MKIEVAALGYGSEAYPSVEQVARICMVLGSYIERLPPVDLRARVKPSGRELQERLVRQVDREMVSEVEKEKGRILREERDALGEVERNRSKNESLAGARY